MLTEYQKMVNRGISKLRYVVEQVFGILKRHYNFARCRYGGLEKVNMAFKLVSMAYNLKEGNLDGVIDIKNLTIRNHQS